MGSIILLATSTLALITSFWVNSNRLQINLILSVCAIVIAIWIGKKTHWLPALAFGYFTLLGLSYIGFPGYFFPGVDLSIIAIFGDVISQSLLYLILPVLILVYLNKEDRFQVLNFICGLALVDSVIMIFKFMFGYRAYFLMDNPALDAAFISCCIPLMLRIRSFNMASLMALSCILSASSSGVLGVGLALSIYYLVNSGFKLKRFIIGSLFAISVAIAGFLSQGKELLDSNGRFNIWHMAMKGWWANSNKFIGTGPGTYVIYGPSIQLDEAVAAGQTSIRSAFLWMHNDWLETLFTTGFIGLGFAVAVFTTAVWTARKLPAVFTSLVVYGAMAFIQMPLRHIIFALLGTLLLLEAFSRQTEIYER